MAVTCEACRSLKMRCVRSGADNNSSGPLEPCDRCKRHNRPCRIPPPRPMGRKPGARGKYRGVEKAVRTIQTELRKAKSSLGATKGLRDLRILCEGDERILESLLDHTEKDNTSGTSLVMRSSGISLTPVPDAQPLDTVSTRHLSPDPVIVTDQLDLQSPSHEEGESISNPISLLADVCGEAQAQELQVGRDRASSLTASHAPEHTPSRPVAGQDCFLLSRQLLGRPNYISVGINTSRERLVDGLRCILSIEDRTCRYPEYFKKVHISRYPDTGPDVDPIDLGLATEADAQHLFNIFFSRLHPINGILDPILHTPEFVRARSSLLFTWIMAISAQFDENSDTLAKRLRNHGDQLSKDIHTKGFKSVEIVQGYYISLLSANPADTLAHERSWLYTIYAFGIARELNLDLCSGSRPDDSYVETSYTQGCTTTDNPDLFERLVRNRQRTWLRMLLWERAHSAARGRLDTFPENALIRNIGLWHLHPLADYTDRHTCAFVMLRQSLALFHQDLMSQLNLPQVSNHWARDLLDSTLQPWCDTWIGNSATRTGSECHISNVFLYYVYSHGRLLALSFALKYQSSYQQDISGIREDCFRAAILCCEMAVHDLEQIGEPLFCMLAPTWAMISYAAVLSLRLFPSLYGTKVSSIIELLALLGQVAFQLERAGTTPSHRFGIAALLGQHLFVLLRSHARGLLDEDFGERVVETNTNQQVPDLFPTSFDPFLTEPIIPYEDAIMSNEFPESLWQWLG